MQRLYAQSNVFKGPRSQRFYEEKPHFELFRSVEARQVLGHDVVLAQTQHGCGTENHSYHVILVGRTSLDAVYILPRLCIQPTLSAKSSPG